MADCLWPIVYGRLSMADCLWPIVYEGLVFEEGFRLDVLVEGLIICELKAAVEHHSVFEAQLLSYLKLTKRRLGYLLNFHSRLMKDGIKRLVI